MLMVLFLSFVLRLFVLFQFLILLRKTEKPHPELFSGMRFFLKKKADRIFSTRRKNLFQVQTTTTPADSPPAPATGQKDFAHQTFHNDSNIIMLSDQCKRVLQNFLKIFLPAIGKRSVRTGKRPVSGGGARLSGGMIPDSGRRKFFPRVPYPAGEREPEPTSDQGKKTSGADTRPPPSIRPIGREALFSPKRSRRRERTWSCSGRRPR